MGIIKRPIAATQAPIAAVLNRSGLTNNSAQAKDMLGNTLVTKQTGDAGKVVNRLYIEDGADIDRELYLSILVDRTTGKNAFVVSTEGGMDIEAVAEETPEKILKEKIDPGIGLQAFQARRLAFGLGLEGDAFKQGAGFIATLAKAFEATDRSLAEINPLVVTGDNQVVALDAKMNFDDNALHRQKKVLAYRDTDEEDPGEVEASKYDLSYIKLDGNIGCLVNGAGLAMGTMDTIKYYGGEPANFLDVGGGATAEKVTAAFEIILKDQVDAIFVNIFGGIMRCDTIAEGVITAAKVVGLGDVPLVVRLAGTNVDKGKQMLAESGLPILAAGDLAEGAQMAVEAANKRNS